MSGNNNGKNIVGDREAILLVILKSCPDVFLSITPFKSIQNKNVPNENTTTVTLLMFRKRKKKCKRNGWFWYWLISYFEQLLTSSHSPLSVNYHLYINESNSSSMEFWHSFNSFYWLTNNEYINTTCDRHDSTYSNDNYKPFSNSCCSNRFGQRVHNGCTIRRYHDEYTAKWGRINWDRSLHYLATRACCVGVNMPLGGATSS